MCNETPQQFKPVNVLSISFAQRLSLLKNQQLCFSFLFFLVCLHHDSKRESNAELNAIHLTAPFKHIFQPNKCKEVNSTQLKENQVKKLATYN
jgi:hypothetical protein